MPPVFILTSALMPEFGVINSSDRFEQTIGTIQSIKEKSAEASIIFVDSSPYAIKPEYSRDIAEQVLYFAELGTINPGLNVKFESRLPFTFLSTLKAVCESYSVLHALAICKVKKLDLSSNRIFKISGRYRVNQEFRVADHLDIRFQGKYAVKEACNSWAFPDQHLYDTKLWSFCPTLIDYSIGLFSDMLCLAINDGLDLEHCLFRCLDKEKVFECHRMNVEGVIASTGGIARE
jgi:hypothetical protein